MILGILTAFRPTPVYALGDDEAHAGASFAATSAIYIAMRSYGHKKTESIFTAAAATAILGMAKELGDDRPSSTDMNADLAGIGAAVMVLYVFDWFE